MRLMFEVRAPKLPLEMMDAKAGALPLACNGGSSGRISSYYETCSSECDNRFASNARQKIIEHDDDRGFGFV